MWAFFARTPSPSFPHVHTMQRFIFVGSGSLPHTLHEFSCPFPPVLHNWSLSLSPFRLLYLVSLSLFIFPQSSLCCLSLHSSLYKEHLKFVVASGPLHLQCPL